MDYDAQSFELGLRNRSKRRVLSRRRRIETSDWNGIRNGNFPVHHWPGEQKFQTSSSFEKLQKDYS